jgi:hypothetical protein
MAGWQLVPRFETTSSQRSRAPTSHGVLWWPLLDKENHLKRWLNIPEVTCKRIEAGITQGYIEGDVYLEDGSHFYWFLER